MILNELVRERKALKNELKRVEKELEMVKEYSTSKKESIIKAKQLKDASKIIKESIKELDKKVADTQKTIDAKRGYFESLPQSLYPKIIAFTETATQAVDDYIQTIKDAYKDIEADIDEYKAKRRDISQHIDLQLSSDLPMQFEPIPNVDLLKIEKIKMMLLDGVAKKQREITHVKKKHERKIKQAV